MLEGWEVKSMRAGMAQLTDTYVHVRDGEAWLINAHITPLSSASTHIIADPMRFRKLLLHAKEIAKIQSGAIFFDERGMRVLPDEIQRRLLSNAVQWVSGSKHGPRRDALLNIMASLKDGQGGTAEGCRICRLAGAIWVFRELNAVRNTSAVPHGLWDRRWVLTPPADHDDPGDWQVRVLGIDGIEQCPDWRSAGLPHLVVLASPSVWQGDKLIAAPLAGYAQNWHAEFVGTGDSFFAALLTH